MITHGLQISQESNKTKNCGVIISRHGSFFSPRTQKLLHTPTLPHYKQWMHPSLNRWLRNILAGAALLTTLQTLADLESGFKPLFNGKSLDGWTTVGKVGDGYKVENNVIVCPKKGGGNLLTEKEYANFILRLEFRLEPV